MQNTYARGISRGTRTKNSDDELIQKNICTDIRLESMFWITMLQSHTSITQFCYFNDDVPLVMWIPSKSEKYSFHFDISDRFINEYNTYDQIYGACFKTKQIHIKCAYALKTTATVI